MISSIEGVLMEVAEGYATLKVGNFSYQVLLPGRLVRKLRQEVGKDVKLFTVHYLEGFARFGNPVERLVGFETELEREFFEKFITVPDIGARRALKALTLPIREIAEAIENEDLSALRGLRGVGEKTAKKMIAELKGQMGKYALSPKGEALEVCPIKEDGEIRGVGVKALVSLGYRPTEAERMVAEALSERPLESLEELIKEVYRKRRLNKP